MDTLCGIGLPELIILALLGFVVIGPERSQEVALKAGRLLRQIMTSTWWREFNQVATAIRDLPTTLVRMAEIEEANKELREALSEIEQGTNIDFNQRPIPGARPTARPGTVATDPWGIRNAVAGTHYTPSADSPPPDSSPSPDDETPDA